ncbi:MAG TPA: hypothetical protein EYN89_11535 [Flavobacteriales bacterium]|nr:hypothetical protein [Flavobacteriales bacterium]
MVKISKLNKLTKIKNEKEQNYFLKTGQLSLFANQQEFCPLTRNEKQIIKLIGELCKEKQLLKWIMDDGSLEPWLTNNNVLDRYLDNKAAIIAKLNKMGYLYTENEENHQRYQAFAAKMQKPVARNIDLEEDEPPF